MWPEQGPVQGLVWPVQGLGYLLLGWPGWVRLRLGWLLPIF